MIVCSKIIAFLCRTMIEKHKLKDDRRRKFRCEYIATKRYFLSFTHSTSSLVTEYTLLVKGTHFNTLVIVYSQPRSSIRKQKNQSNCQLVAQRLQQRHSGILTFFSDESRKAFPSPFLCIESSSSTILMPSRSASVIRTKPKRKRGKL